MGAQQSSQLEVMVERADHVRLVVEGAGTDINLGVESRIRGAGIVGVVFGNKMSEQELADWKALIQREPRRFIAQEVIDFRDLEIIDEGKRVMRKADLRAFVLSVVNPAALSALSALSLSSKRKTKTAFSPLWNANA